ncbi:MAG: hypothetical protein LUC89_04295 [Oscillospiraceae bacterium]|nr:hypothetical protein [Oscillospiraceae bacterium]
MSERDHMNFTPDYGEYSPDTVLEDYRNADGEAQSAPGPERASDRSRQKPSSSLENALRAAMSQYRQDPPAPAASAPQSENASAESESQQDETAEVGQDDSADLPGEPQDAQSETVSDKESETSSPQPRKQAQISPDGIITLDMDLPWGTAPARQSARSAKTARPARFEDYVRREAEATGVFPAYRDTPETVRNTPETPTRPESRDSEPPIRVAQKRPAAEKHAAKEPTQDAERPAPENQRFRREQPVPEEARPRRTLRQLLTDEDETQELDEQDDFQESEEGAEQPASRLERLLRPIVRQAATFIAKREMRRAEAAKWPDPVEEPEEPELPPKKAGKFYAQQLHPLRFRCRVCLFLCVVLAWISLQLPMAGMLGQSTAVQAGACLILTLSVMVAALDIVAAGMRQLFDLHPGAESLAVLGSMFSCIDALLVMLGYGDSLPFCAVGAFSLSAALWGERRYCLGQTRTLRVASFSKAASVVSGENGEQPYLIRSQRGPEGIVRRSEQPDMCQSIYATAAPILLVACLILAVLASLSDGSRFLHNLSAMLSVSASFTAFLSFPLPYSVTAKRLQSSGAAVAGYAGCTSIGKNKRLVITDEDLFPAGTVRLNLINIQEGTFVPKVISSTYSLLEASGSGLTGVFQELMQRRGYVSLPIEEFQCHEGGGLSGLVRGERVLVGSAGFMNLMGIRLPQNMTTKNTICTAINQELVAVFTLEYTPTSSVQDALVTLLQGQTQPVFAIRDFNITPLMIRQLFRMPTDNFNFPSFQDRYRIAATTEKEDSPIAAIVSRGGMGPMVDAVEAGRRLYNTCRIGVILSLVGSITGLLILFLLFRVGSYDTATVGNVLSYMLLWAMPVAFLSLGQGR